VPKKNPVRPDYVPSLVLNDLPEYVTSSDEEETDTNHSLAMAAKNHQMQQQ